VTVRANPFSHRWASVLAERAGDVAILSPDGETLRTYSKIGDAAKRWNEGFDKVEGVVAVQLGNSPEWPEVLLGAWMAGRTVVAFDPDLAGERRARVEELCGVGCRVECGADGATVISLSNEPVEALADFSFLKLTSGTTGEPRPICFRGAQLLADCDNVCETMGVGAGDINYGVASFGHSYGFSNLITPLIARGVPLVATQDRFPRAIIEGLRSSRATVLPGVPALFRALADMEHGSADLRLCLSAGAPLTSEIARRFHASWGLKVHSFYGASECGGICYDASEEIDVPEGFVGGALKNVTIVAKGDGDEFGVEVRGASVGEGYHPDPGFHGIYEPADLLRRECDGFVIAGRVSDVINVGGRKVNPAEIEQVLRSCPGVADVVVLGVPNGVRGEDIAACVVGGVAEKTLRDFCAARLPAWQLPRVIRELPQIPLNARGKVSRAELRKAFGS
jgi:acyl-CoA synthetase (AMP-forming)/AMP-acid ligase II